MLAMIDSEDNSSSGKWQHQHEDTFLSLNERSGCDLKIEQISRKKLRSELCRQYPNVSKDAADALIPTKDEVTVAKVCTHSDENVLVYSAQQNPILFELHHVVYPTVYTLWRYPEIMITFSTWPPVLSKLQGGADLMLPGVIVPDVLTPEALGSFPKDQSCSVKLKGNRAPVAVGYTSMSSQEMINSGMRGKGVIILHTYRDQLWALGNKSDLPDLTELSLESSEETAVANSSEFTTQDNCANPDLAENKEQRVVADVGDALASCCVQETENASASDIMIQEKDENPATEPTSETSSRESMDVLFDQCFLYALKKNLKHIQLPILTSSFYRNYMLPCCPKGSVLDVKKSSFKKLSKFLSAKQEEGIIKVEELTKGVDSITLINQDSERLSFFKIPNWTLDIREPEAPSSGGIEYTPPHIAEVFIVTAHVLPFMKLFGKMKGSVMTSQEVRQIVTEYVKDKKLQDQSNVQLDELLGSILINKNEYSAVLHWNDVFERFLSKMTAACQITFPGSEPQIRKGSLEHINLDVKQRGANKKVTLIRNLDVYGIDPDQFAATVQKGVSCSTSVDKSKGVEVLVQGNQINFIKDLLVETYKLPLKYIDGLQKAPKVKK